VEEVAMTSCSTFGILGALLLAMPGAAQTTRPAPSSLFVEVSVVPTAQAFPILVPGDRTDKPAFVAEIALTTAEGLAATPAVQVRGRKRLVVFPGEAADGSFAAGDLSVKYRITVDLEKKTADTRVRVTRGAEFVGGSSTRISLAAPIAGVQHAPGS
jgi:hypothetical protein